MIIIKTDLILKLGLYGLAWFPPFIFVWSKATNKTINEEKIHIMQWVSLAIVGLLIELLLVYGFHAPVWIGLVLAYFSRWLWYLVEYTIYRLQGMPHWFAYYAISFEKEAKANSDNDNYWKDRPFWGHLKYL